MKEEEGGTYLIWLFNPEKKNDLHLEGKRLQVYK